MRRLLGQREAAERTDCPADLLLTSLWYSEGHNVGALNKSVLRKLNIYKLNKGLNTHPYSFLCSNILHVGVSVQNGLDHQHCTPCRSRGSLVPFRKGGADQLGLRPLCCGDPLSLTGIATYRLNQPRDHISEKKKQLESVPPGPSIARPGAHTVCNCLDSLQLS